MNDIDKELSSINQDFNNALESKNNGFSLTKMFKKNGYINKITKAMLIMSLTVGAFGNIANAHTTELLNSQAEIHNVINQQYNKGEGLIDYNKLDILTPETLEEIAENEISGIWKHHTSGEIVIVTQNGKLEINDSKLSKKIEEFLNQKNYQINEENPYPHAKDFYESDIKVVNLNKKHSLIYKNNLINKELYPLLYKFQNDFTAHHEMDHVSQTQLIKKNEELGKISKKYFTGDIMREMASDINAVATLIKTKNLSFEDAIQLIEELEDLRTEGFQNHFDIGHATQGSLLAFKNNLIKNPNNFEAIKKMDYDQLGQLTADFAFESFAQLEGIGNVDAVTKTDMVLDLKSFIKNGKTLEKKQSVIHKKMSEVNGFDGSTALDSIDYEGFLNALSDRMDEKGVSAEKSVAQFMYSKRHARGLTMVKLLDGFSDKILEQNKLDNIINAHITKSKMDFYMTVKQENRKKVENSIEKELEKNITNTATTNIATKQTITVTKKI